ncbi:quinone oxidoreductase family protein [Aeromicrobium fastidiosum]|uniref:Zinc-binding dehydrogenase n=1 Tax=Aeromicrobium fastidiosum TaxID=52699 RepID=A0A641AHC2_9ACTN|nr:zinc-binding dehydrogenase [Aeromicrobium fastidiosum]KAA1373091.1 zinc-binding dehydrogenase [Aeromicrobium fastidiosum]MBP2391076.1 NADPH:quinone reductase-like Zn-dependent oxidoreductase [Aeromicrobium fastidiosum]
MLAAYARTVDPADPLDALEVGDVESATAPPGWVTITMRAASLNRHDLWSLAGVGLPADRTPMILGCDLAGVDENGREVVVYPVIASDGWTGPELDDPALSMLSERHPGTFAEQVAVPTHNLLPVPDGLTLVEASTLPTAWLTAYRMIFTAAQVRAGQTILVQGATGGVSTAAIMLGRAAGLRVWATSRSDEGRQWARDIGAHETFESGARLPERVDAVLDTVGQSTWDHSLKCLRRHGVMVVSGGTSGYQAQTNVARVFAGYARIQGSTLGTRQEFADLLQFVTSTGIKPPVHRTYPLAEARAAFTALAGGDVRGKLVITS